VIEVTPAGRRVEELKDEVRELAGELAMARRKMIEGAPQ
jgi:hypothetical protein